MLTFIATIQVTEVNANMETVKPDTVEFKHRSLSGYGSHISSDFQLLNNFNTRNQSEVLPRTSENPYTRHGANFRDVANENFLDSKIFSTSGGTRLYPLPSNRPYYLHRSKIFGDYWLCDSFSDNFKLPYKNGGKYAYSTIEKSNLLGFILKAHPMNTENVEQYKEFLAKFQEVNLTPPDGITWNPVNPEVEQHNDIIRTTDYARYVYYHETFKDPSDIERKESKLESNNNIRYWYKDSSGYASAIRPLEISDYLSKYSMFSIKECHVIDGRSIPSRKERNRFFSHFTKELNNKIIVIEHRRINLTGNEKDPNCPLLIYYLNNGWSIEEEDPDSKNGNTPIHSIFRKAKESMKIGMGDGVSQLDHGIFRETTYKGSVKYFDYASGEIKETDILNLRSVLLVKTTMIDIEEVGLRDRDCVYIPTVDLVFGKMKSGIGDEKLYPVDLYQHPYHKYHINRLECEDGINITYVSEDPRDTTPLYSNTHGLITKIHPSKNSKLKPGLYIQTKDNTHCVELDKIHKYGFFYSKRDASTYNILSEEMLTYVKNGRENLLRDKKFEQEMLSLEIKNQSLQHTRDVQEIMDKIKDKELGLRKSDFDIKEMEQAIKKKEAELKVELLAKQREIEELKSASSMLDNATKLITTVVSTGTRIATLF